MDLSKLHPRLQVVARQTIDGVRSAATAAELGVSEKTVSRLRREVYEALGVHSTHTLAGLFGKTIPHAGGGRKKPPHDGMRQGMSLGVAEMDALDRVLTAAEMGRDVRVMVRDQTYRRARAVLVRAAQAARRKMAATERDTGVVAKLDDSTQKAG